MSDSTFKPTPLTVHELGFLDLDLASRPQVISGVAFLDRAVDLSNAAESSADIGQRKSAVALCDWRGDSSTLDPSPAILHR